MSELQNRRYKEVTPLETVERLKRILNEMHIEVEENWIKESSVGTYSLRLCIKGTNLGQNGKGMTKEFAMASAYAEFFERLQNGVIRFRIEKPSPEFPFSYAPDEKHISRKELMKTHNSILENILEINNFENKTIEEKLQYLDQLLGKEDSDNDVATPYYSINHQEIEYIPQKLFDYLFTSNGMCAGNSPEEALIEGLSEILERYVAIQIAKKKIVLPEIPENYIEHFPKVKDMVKKLKENDQFYFRLVDCSLGGKYPVAGLYILEKNTGKFGFKLGAHPDYGIAMERCFTEAAQGRDIYEYAKICIFDFYKQDENSPKVFTNFIFSDFSEVPYQMIGENTTYKFMPVEDVSNLDNKTILQNLIKTILKEKRDILIRDVSTLGFPAFSIIIPGMSEVGIDHNCTYFKLINTLEDLLKDFKKITLSNIPKVINIMETIINEVGCEQLSFFISLKDTSILPCEQIGMSAKYFLAIIYIMNSEYHKATKLLYQLDSNAENLIENPLEKIMIKSVYYYASAMDKLKEHEKAMYYIRLLFDEQIAMGIDFSFKDRELILINHFGISDEDYVDDDDSYCLPFMKQFRKAQKDNIINQMKNKELFN